MHNQDKVQIHNTTAHSLFMSSSGLSVSHVSFWGPNFQSVEINIMTVAVEYKYV